MHVTTQPRIRWRGGLACVRTLLSCLFLLKRSCFLPPCYLLYTLPVNRRRLLGFLFIHSVLSHCSFLKALLLLLLSCFRLFATLWSEGHQASLSMGKNTGMGCHFLLQRIFLTQGLNPCLFYLLNWQAGSLPLLPPGEIQQAETPQMSPLSRKPLPPQCSCLWRRKTLEKARVRYLIFKLISLSR